MSQVLYHGSPDVGSVLLVIGDTCGSYTAISEPFSQGASLSVAHAETYRVCCSSCKRTAFECLLGCASGGIGNRANLGGGDSS